MFGSKVNKAKRVYDAMVGFPCRVCGIITVATNIPVPAEAEISINLPGAISFQPAPIHNMAGETIMLSHRHCEGCGYREWVVD